MAARREPVRTEPVRAVKMPRFLTLTGSGTPERLQAGYVTAEAFPVVGVSPARGRGFSAEEDRPGGRPVAVLSHGYWSDRFGSSPDAIGRIVRVDGVAREIVGVMPRDFTLPREVLALAILLSVFVIYAHRANIRRLMRGEENSFRKRKPVNHAEDEKVGR